ncbi:HAD family hydrolase [Alkalibacter mobilis]|uniref:HAD family hydrolase n=1 Tax=Alkalibacter mobilis TaxID=2787712 RepID=UPI0018A017A5|nr:HAD family hydrolase [Alkalibacter mobilis]
MPDVKTIFMDFDGTLHETLKIYKPAFCKAYDFLVDQGVAQERSWNDGEISRWLGYTAGDMWNSFMPDLDPDIKNRASLIIRDEMHSQLIAGNGSLYEGTEQVLKTLVSMGITLVFLSNCRNSYMEAVKEIYGLDRYFKEFIATESWDFKPKYQIIKSIKDSYQKELLVVGDRIHDVEAGFLNDIKAVGCTYGYGSKEELSLSDFRINEIIELLDII